MRRNEGETPRCGDEAMTALMGGRAMTRVVGGVGGDGGDGGLGCRYYEFCALIVVARVV